MTKDLLLAALPSIYSIVVCAIDEALANRYLRKDGCKRGASHSHRHG